MILRKLVFATLFLLFCRMASAAEVLVIESKEYKVFGEALDGFRSSCGCTTGEPLVLSGKSEREISTEIRKSSPKLIAAIGDDSLKMVKGIKDIPIVYFMISNPGSLLSSEENITGVSMQVSPERQLTILKEVLPNVKSVGLIYDPDNTGLFIKKAQDASNKLEIKILHKEVSKKKVQKEVQREVTSAIQNIVKEIKESKEGIHLLWMVYDETVITPETVLVFLDSSLKNGIPLFTYAPKILEMGAVISVSADPVDMGKQAGEMAKKILSSSEKKVTNLPRSDARKAVLGLNLITAKKIGITFNSEAISKAQNIINEGIK